MEKYKEEFNNFIIDNEVIGFFAEPITLKSGRKSNWYVNWRTVVEDVFLTDKLADFIINFIKNEGIKVDTFYGVPEGATKIGVITQYKFAKQNENFSKGNSVLAMGRAKPKEHGIPKDKYFVGIPNGKVVIIEDVTTTGGSLIETINNLKEAQIEISAVISLTNRMEKRDDGKSVKQFIEEMGVKFYNMSSALELLPVIYEKTQPGIEIAKSIEQEFQEYGVEPINFNKNINMNMADKLLDAIDKKQNPCVVGLDPTIDKIPKNLIKGNSFESIADAIRKFNYGIIDAVADLIPAVKPQIAFYEKYGAEGIKAFKDTVDYAKSKGLIVIEDGKRNDISTTAQAYAEAHLGKVKTQTSSAFSINADLLTVNPYLGSDGLKPFFEVSKEFGKGIFILVKTSNPSSGELQDRLIEITSNEKDELKTLGIELNDNKTELYKLVGLQVNKLAQQLKGNRGYSPIGAVVGATYPEQAVALRNIMPNSIFLVPGYGAQGGGADDVITCFNNDGYGAVVNSSRGIIFAYEKSEKYKENFAEAAREATLLMIKDINSALKKAGKLPAKWKF